MTHTPSLNTSKSKLGAAGRLRCMAGAVLLGLASTSLSASASSPEYRAMETAVNAAVQSEDFKALDTHEQDLRVSKKTDANGTWLLSYFHDAVLYHPRMGGGDVAGFDSREGFFQRWVRAAPKSLAAPVLLAETYRYRAGFERGTKPARDVTPPGSGPASRSTSNCWPTP